MPQNTPISLPRQRRMASAAEALERIDPAADPARALYIHVPFCFHKCHYCDFYSLEDPRDRQRPFLDRLIRELQALSPWAGALRTIFVGGGTPSLLRVDLWRRLLAALHDAFELSALEEFTVECNPETVSPELMGVLAAGGVNRVSVGAQSFNRAHLKTLERWHEPDNVGRALEMAAAAGIGRRSLDLIFAIPGQTLEDWKADLRTALSLGTTHLSCYNLTYEPGTAMTARKARGAFTAVDEQTEAEMYITAVDTLRARGLERYEVSNFAIPGQEARHNLAYWRQEPWLAAGPSASAHVGGHRWKNVPRLDDYLDFDDRGFAPITDHEPPDERRALAEQMMTGLRVDEGLRIAEILARAKSLGAGERLQKLANQYAMSGHLKVHDGRWRPSDSGFLIADTLAVEFMGALDA